MRASFLGTLLEEEWKRYQSELERKTGVAWNRVAFMERTWEVIRRYGTQSVMKVVLNQPPVREVLEKLMSSTESDVLTESVTEDSAVDHQTTKRQPIRRAKKGQKRLRSRAGRKTEIQKVIKTKVNAAVTLAKHLARVKLDMEIAGIGWGKKKLIPPMLLAGLISTASKSRKNARTLADTKLEVEVIGQCGSGGFVEMLQARNLARGHSMAWSEKNAMQQYLQELTENSNLKRKSMVL